MFEILKLFVETIRAALPAIATARKEKRLSRLGGALFLFYVKGNETVAIGNRIFDLLENYVDRIENGSEYVNAHAGDWIAGMLQPLINRQYQNLRDLDAAMGDLEVELQIVDGPGYNSLRALYGRKVTAIGRLQSALGSGALPLGPTEADLQDLTILRLQGEDFDWSEVKGPRGLTAREIINPIRAGAIQTSRPFTINDYEAITKWLASREWRSELQAIESALGDLREALLANFSLRDILLSVGTSRP
jgi:hypothetical protein